MLTVLIPQPRSSETFGAERGCPEIRDSSIERPHAQPRADLESPRARVPCMAGSDFSPATVPRGTAHTAYWKRFLGAYGSHRPSARTLCSTSGTKFPASPADRRREPELPVTVASLAGTRRRRLRDPSTVQMHAPPRAEAESLRAPVPYIRDCESPLASGSGTARYVMSYFGWNLGKVSAVNRPAPKSGHDRPTTTLYTLGPWTRPVTVLRNFYAPLCRKNSGDQGSRSDARSGS